MDLKHKLKFVTNKETKETAIYADLGAIWKNKEHQDRININFLGIKDLYVLGFLLPADKRKAYPKLPSYKFSIEVSKISKLIKELTALDKEIKKAQKTTA